MPGMASTEPSSDIRFYPPSIPISDDGEGGYIPQSALRTVNEEINRPFTPAPNRTICSEGENPPPYLSRSVGFLDHASLQDWSSRNQNSQHATTRRTYSMSSSTHSKKGGTNMNCVTTASSTSPLLGSSRSATCTSSSPPLHHHHAHPPASMSRTVNVPPSRRRSAHVATVCPIQPPGYSEYPGATSPPSLDNVDDIGPPPDYELAVAGTDVV